MSTTLSPVRVGKNSDRNFREVEKVLESASAFNSPDSLVKRGTDGGLEANRLRLFGGFDISGPTSHLRSNLEVSPGVAIQSDFQSGVFGAGYRLEANRKEDGMSYLEIDNIQVRGSIQAAIFQKDVVRAVGGDVFVTDAAVLSREVWINGTGVTTIYVADDVFEVGDILWVKDAYILFKGITSKFMQVTGAAVPSGNLTTYQVTGIGASIVQLAVGSTVVRVGSASDSSRRGALYMTASQVDGPYYDVYDGRSSSASVTPKIRIGKLSGLTDAAFPTMGTGSDLYGIYVSGSAFLKGSIVASAGEIAGWTINANNLAKNNATLHSSGYLLLGTANDVVRVDATDATYRLWVGHASAASAPLTITKAGAFTATSATIKSSTGTKRLEIRSSDNEMEFFEGGSTVARIGSNAYSTYPGLYVADGIIHVMNTTKQFGGMYGKTQSTAVGTGSAGVRGDLGIVDTDNAEEPYGGVYGYADFMATNGATYTLAAKYVGVRGYALGAGATTETISGKDFYGGHFTAECGTPARFAGGSFIGIYAAGNTWAGYFNTGDVKIINNLFVDTEITVTGDSNLATVRSGNIRMNSTLNTYDLEALSSAGAAFSAIFRPATWTGVGPSTVQLNLGDANHYLKMTYGTGVKLATSNSLELAATGGITASNDLTVAAVAIVTGAVSASYGNLYLNNGTSNHLVFGANGAGAPAFTTRSAGTKVVIYQNVGVSTVDFALGYESSAMWVSVPNSSGSIKYYAATTNIADLSGGGNWTYSGETWGKAQKHYLGGTKASIAVAGLGVYGTGNTRIVIEATSGNAELNLKQSTNTWAIYTGSGSIFFYNAAAKAEINTSGDYIATRAVVVKGDNGTGVTSSLTLTNVSSAGSAGATFTVKGVSGATARNSAGFIKIWVGTTAYYVPYFDAITG